jgi:hypothetical protein
MRFTIEVLRTIHGDAAVLARERVFAIRSSGVKKKAFKLLEQWQGRGATAVRVLNSSGEEIYFMTSASDR